LANVERGITLQNAPSCAALALRGELDAKPAIALGQNLSWNPLIARSPVVLRLEPDDAPPIVTLTEDGMLAKIGFNAQGLGVCLNFFSHVDDGRPGVFGVPIRCLLRAVLECQSIKQAVGIVESSRAVRLCIFPGGTARRERSGGPGSGDNPGQRRDHGSRRVDRHPRRTDLGSDPKPFHSDRRPAARKSVDRTTRCF